MFKILHITIELYLNLKFLKHKKLKTTPQNEAI